MGTLRNLLKFLSVLFAVLIAAVIAMIFLKFWPAITDEPVTTLAVFAAYAWGCGLGMLFWVFTWRWINENLGEP